MATANPARGWQLLPDPDRPRHRTAAGRLAIPLKITYDGRYIATADYVIDGPEAESLRSWLDAGLAGDDDPDQVPPRIARRAALDHGVVA